MALEGDGDDRPQALRALLQVPDSPEAQSQAPDAAPSPEKTYIPSLIKINFHKTPISEQSSETGPGHFFVSLGLFLQAVDAQTTLYSSRRQNAWPQQVKRCFSVSPRQRQFPLEIDIVTRLAYVLCSRLSGFP
ncbi:hypothetical protein AVEN_106240-1 [Araneus ventricosus]|uniref:Uncharacterized protein n=1 Tax=Araneus ventricosus TaxID=182803 RepID=A0A4Y2HI86_ARAVE|nr:hypothetical protein AVEN_106240-1 [Araneus ventricosus]